MTDPISIDLHAYKDLLPQLLKDEGKYALLFGGELLGVYGTYEDALNAGYEKAKLQPFLVKKISGVETIAYFTRDVPACPISL